MVTTYRSEKNVIAMITVFLGSKCIAAVDVFHYLQMPSG